MTLLIDITSVITPERKEERNGLVETLAESVPFFFLIPKTNTLKMWNQLNLRGVSGADYTVLCAFLYLWHIL